MKAKELSERLNAVDENMEVMIETNESGSFYIKGFEISDNCVYLSGE